MESLARLNANVLRQSIRRRRFDPEALASIVNGGHFEHYILTRARCDVRHRRAACGTFSIDTASYNFPVRACGGFAGKTMAVTYFRSLAGPVWVNGFTFGLSSLQIYPAGCEVNCRMMADAEWVAIEMEESALQAAAIKRLGRPLSLRWNGAVNLPVSTEGLRMLDRIGRYFLDQECSGLETVPAILGALAEVIASGNKSPLPELSRRWRHREELLNRAESFLAQHESEPFDGAALAASVGATERCIQQHFADAYGLSPARWARCRALHRVRQQLQAGSARLFTLEGIANDFGFRHMGRFAGYYKDLFGESPSITTPRWSHDDFTVTPA